MKDRTWKKGGTAYIAQSRKEQLFSLVSREAYFASFVRMFF